jgi:hypothetical protein
MLRLAPIGVSRQEDRVYTLIRAIRIRQLIMEQIPSIGISFLVAEHFYKFHSFTLECLAFLGTWFVVDLCVTSLLGLFRRQQGTDLR